MSQSTTSSPNSINTLLCEDLRAIINGSFGIAMNANDFFNYSCADMVLIDAQDLEWVIPIYKKYSWKGIDACMAFIAKQMPIKLHITKEFEEAYAEMKNLILKFIPNIRMAVNFRITATYLRLGWV